MLLEQGKELSLENERRVGRNAGRPQEKCDRERSAREQHYSKEITPDGGAFVLCIFPGHRISQTPVSQGRQDLGIWSSYWF